MSSEVMAILALSSDLNDLRARLEKIVVAYTQDDQPIFAGQLGVVGAMLVLLRDAMEKGPAALNQLEKEGVIQRFEYCFELAWKTVKDYLEESGFVFATVTPRQVLKDAFAARILADGQVWIDMLDHRNLLSHTYSLSNFQKAVEAVAARYLPAMDALHEFFLKEIQK